MLRFHCCFVVAIHSQTEHSSSCTTIQSWKSQKQSDLNGNKEQTRNLDYETKIKVREGTCTRAQAAEDSTRNI